MAGKSRPRKAAPPTPEQLAARKQNKEEARKAAQAKPPTPEEKAARKKAKEEAKKLASAAPPTAAQLAARKKNKEEAKEAARATPGTPKPSSGHKCAGALYKVTSNKVVHGKRKGETVSLCPHKGATLALVESGHLVPVESATAKAVTTSSSAKVTDGTKGADHG